MPNALPIQPMPVAAGIHAPTAGEMSDSAALEVLQQHSLNALVQRTLERRILSGELPPGAKLIEADIAAALGVSRGPVREAFRTLAQSGLVRTEKNRGVFVRRIAPGEVDDLYEVRAVLDGLIGRLAAKRIRPPQLARLKDLVWQMHAAERTRDATAYFPLNIEFHDVLGEASGNRSLLANYRRIVNELTLYRRQIVTRNSENMPLSTREHEAIVEALEARHAALAERLMVGHVVNSRVRLHEALKTKPVARGKSTPESA